jgi:hypothetical protein
VDGSLCLVCYEISGRRWDNRGDSSAKWAFADFTFSLALDYRAMSDSHVRDIRDGIVRAGWKITYLYSQFPCPASCCLHYEFSFRTWIGAAPAVPEEL